MPKKSTTPKKGRVRFDEEFGGYYGWLRVTGKRWQRKTIGFSTIESAAAALKKLGVTDIETGPRAPEHMRPVRIGAAP